MMSSVFEVQRKMLVNGRMFATKRKTSECPYCGSTFEPAFHAPTKDQTWGHWEVFCSQVCRRFWAEEKRESREM
jgi:hypothetical protein